MHDLINFQVVPPFWWPTAPVRRQNNNGNKIQQWAKGGEPQANLCRGMKPNNQTRSANKNYPIAKLNLISFVYIKDNEKISKVNPSLT